MIFVDGPDGVGKTGYSQYLSRELGLPRLEMRPVEDTDGIEAKSRVFNAAIRDLHDQGVRLVIDRGSVSSIVYSTVFNREEPKHAWSTLEHCDLTVVYLRCDAEELAVRYGNNDELFTDEEIAELAKTYDSVMDEVSALTNVKVVTIDTTADVISKLHRRIPDLYERPGD